MKGPTKAWSVCMYDVCILCMYVCNRGLCSGGVDRLEGVNNIDKIQHWLRPLA